MERSNNAGDPSVEGVDYHYLVHQATGVFMNQFGLGPTDALEKLKAEAAESGRPLTAFAGEIVDDWTRESAWTGSYGHEV
jgi:hypothetical protein